MKKVLIILISAIILRIILAASSFHSDAQVFALGGQIINSGNILDFYDVGVNSYPQFLLNYPPAIYFYHGLFSFFTSFLFTQSLINNFLFNITSVLGRFEINLYLLSLKLPLLVFDLLIAFVLYKLFPQKKYWALGLWLFNPVNLFATYLMGQFDIIPTFFVTAAILIYLNKISFLRLDYLTLAALTLGIGAAFKIYPLFLLIPLAVLANSWASRFKLVILGVIPYILTILPFLPSPAFRQTALVANQTQKSLYAQIPISGGESILLFPAVLIFFYFLFFYQKNDLWPKFLVILLTFFIFTHYHPQWFLWITPLLIFDLIYTNFKHLLVVVVMVTSFILSLFLFDPGLTVWLFSPVFPNLYNQPELWKLLNFNIDINQARSVLHTIFASAAIYLIYYYFPKDAKN